MKKLTYLLSIFVLGIVISTWYSCQKDSDESCVPDDYCEGKVVTACCTDDDVCVWKYNGKEYTADEEEQLLADLNCPVAYTPDNYKAAKADVIDRLHALMDKARAGLK